MVYRMRKRYGTRPHRKTYGRRYARYARRKPSYQRRVLNQRYRPEYKRQDLHSYGFDPFGGGYGLVSAPLNTLLKGTSNFNRVGDVVIVKSLNIRLNVWSYSSASTHVNNLRVTLVHDKFTEGIQPTYADLFTDPDPTKGIRNQDNLGRFTILSDKVHKIGPWQSIDDRKFIHIYKRMNMRMRFNSGNVGTVADIEQGGLFLFFTSTGIAGDLQGNVQSQITFVDN